MSQLVTTLPVEFAKIASVLQLDAQLVGDYSVKAVDGRLLQQALESTKDHTTWIKVQLKRLNLIEGEDYEVRSAVALPSGGSRENIRKTPFNRIHTYAFTIDAAKTIAISSEASNGHLVRKYFLHMEKIAQEAYRGKLPPSISGDREKDAISEAEWEAKMICSAMGTAWSTGYHQKVIHDTFKRHGDAFGVDIVSKLPDLTIALPNQIEETDPTKGEHLLAKAIGGKQLNTQEIANEFGITTTGLYAGLVQAGVLRRLNAKGSRNISGYALTPNWIDTGIATTQKLQWGKLKGTEKITALHWSVFTPELKQKLKEFADTNIKYKK